MCDSNTEISFVSKLVSTYNYSWTDGTDRLEQSDSPSPPNPLDAAMIPSTLWSSIVCPWALEYVTSIPT